MNLLVILALLVIVYGYFLHRNGGLQAIARGREYKSGTRWGFWRWTYTDTGYITRLHVFKAPFGAICLHWINKPDPEPFLHDHPVSFLSIILRGEYGEWRGASGGSTTGGFAQAVKYTHHRWFNWIRASEKWRHTICHVKPGTLTLCLMGPKTREWGFHRAGYWQFWKSYYDELIWVGGVQMPRKEAYALAREKIAKYGGDPRNLRVVRYNEAERNK